MSGPAIFLFGCAARHAAHLPQSQDAVPGHSPARHPGKSRLSECFPFQTGSSRQNRPPASGWQTKHGRQDSWYCVHSSPAPFADAQLGGIGTLRTRPRSCRMRWPSESMTSPEKKALSRKDGKRDSAKQRVAAGFSARPPHRGLLRTRSGRNRTGRDQCCSGRPAGCSSRRCSCCRCPVPDRRRPAR